MLKFTAQRLLTGLLTAFIVSVLILLIVRATFDPLNYLVCMDDCVFTGEELRKIKEDFGVHGALHVQYFRWMGGWVTGNWGKSIFSSETIWEDFIARLPATFQLVVITQAIAALVGLPAGVFMALQRNSWMDLLGRTLSKVWLTLPIFLMGILLTIAGFYLLEWYSFSTSRNSRVVDIPEDSLTPFILSALTLGIYASAAVALMVRSSTLDVSHKDNYLQAMPPSGPGYSIIVFLHTIRIAIVPGVTALCLTFPAIAGGVLIMERIFSLNGVGSMFVEAINQRDYAVTESLALFFAVWVIAVNTLVDIICGWLDADTRRTRKSPREEWNHLANPVRLL